MKIHMIGIGGAGNERHRGGPREQRPHVTGSDLKESPYTRRLREAGITVYIGHAPDQVGDAEQVVISTAIPNDEPRAPRSQAQFYTHNTRAPRRSPGSWRVAAASPWPGPTARRRRRA